MPNDWAARRPAVAVDSTTAVTSADRDIALLTCPGVI
jgi:hypothetical protein